MGLKNVSKGEFMDENEDIIMNDSDVDAFIKDLSQDITFDDESDLYETDDMDISDYQLYK
jgi:hypothetical protein